MTLKKAITDLKLSAANDGKLHALEALAVEHTCHVHHTPVKSDWGKCAGDELNQLPFGEVKALLQTRFANRPSSDARSVSARLDTLRNGDSESPTTVNQPGLISVS